MTVQTSAHTTSPAAGTRRGPVVPTPPGRGLRSRLVRHSVLLAALAALVCHLLFLHRAVGIDEGGYAMVARFWRAPGSYLYGPQWVDRPPGLIGVFAVADRLGPYGVRLTAAVLAAALVLALAWAAEAVGGRPAARWTAWTAFALASSTLFQAEWLNGELVAGLCVAVSIGALLHAVHRAPNRSVALLLGALSGAAATAAVLAKQNFVDAFAFALVLLVAGTATRLNRRTYRPERTAAIGAGFLLGVGVLAAGAWVWAEGHGGPAGLGYALFGFRADAALVMAHGRWTAPLERMGILALVAAESGLLLLLGHLAVAHRRRLLRVDPLPWALVAAVVVEVVGIVGGANFWTHYLLALVPTVALAAGLGVHARMPGARWTRRLVVLAVAATLVVTPVSAALAAGRTTAAYTTGRWLAASAQSGDTLAVPFTHSNVIDASGLAPAYPYSWSLPVRTLDPHLSLFVRTLDGPHAPTWVVRWDTGRVWGLDPHHRVDAALHAHYRKVAHVCGHPVWLHDGADRSLAPLPTVCGGDEG